jgi:hypothetical protein
MDIYPLRSTKKLTLENFIQKANLTHKFKYDYSKVVYTGNKNKVIIICSIHGEFQQTPNSHLCGQGCMYCYNIKRQLPKYDINEFINRAKIKHGNKYDYSSVDYNGTKHKVIIICPIHGKFLQSPKTHMNGIGCMQCGHNLCGKLNTKSTENFIRESQQIHNNKYDYSKSIYYGGKKKVKITCPIHGEFLQTAEHHLRGCDCPRCSIIDANILKNKTTKIFLENARHIHGESFIYNKVEYTHSKLPVIITCMIHGDFKQTPNSHLQGQGCPFCKSSKGEQKIRNILINKHYNFKEQYRIKECRNKKPLPFDFAILQNNNLIGLIEYQGQQHFQEVKYFGGRKIFEVSKIRDNIKKEFCYNNKIPLLEITYKEQDCITEIITTFISRILSVHSQI